MIEQYLARNAEPEAQALHSGATVPANVSGLALQPLHASHAWQGCLVIPVFDECFATLQRQITALADTNTLILLVVNAPQGGDPDAIERTLGLLSKLRTSDFAQVILVDKASPERQLSPKQGVGMARKIGCDLALTLIHIGRVRSPWILQSDADVEFPEGYTQLFYDNPERSASGAKIYPHTHVSEEPTLHFAAQLYDQHMNYYVAGLQLAGSRYGHHSLGSTIAVHATSYAAVRGYPKRPAGEDFYLLNKIRKVAGVERLAGPILKIEARLSTRVPFGTGQALRDIVGHLAQDPSGNSYRSYHPECFITLGKALQEFEHWAANPAADFSAAVSQHQANIGFARFAKSIGKQNPSSARRLQGVHDWFDGLKTLQFIHSCQRHYADQPLLQTLANIDPVFRDKVFEFQTNTD